MTESQFNNLDISLSNLGEEIENLYQTNILDNYNNEDANLTYDNYSTYKTIIDDEINTLQNSISTQKNSVSNYISDISDTVLQNMDASNTYIRDRINHYEQRRKYLHDLMMKYNNIEGRLVDAQSNKYYTLFLIWSIIFIIVLTVVFTNVIETRSSMNLLSKAILFIFIIYLVHLIIKNLNLYLNGYSVLK
jgi:hypothetical protein